MHDYRVRWTDMTEFAALRAQHWNSVFPEIAAIGRDRLLGPESLTRSMELRKEQDEVLRLVLVVEAADGSLAGWSYGFQRDGDKFFMCNSAVLPNHRRKGVYTLMLSTIIERATNHGFQAIVSHHHPTNNSVLIPKLKAGFTIQGLEIDERYGTLVSLVYYPNERCREVMQYRVGATRPDARYLALFEPDSSS